MQHARLTVVYFLSYRPVTSSGVSLGRLRRCRHGLGRRHSRLLTPPKSCPLAFDLVAGSAIAGPALSHA